MFGSDTTSRQKSHYFEQHIKLANGKNFKFVVFAILLVMIQTLFKKMYWCIWDYLSTYLNDSLEDQSFLFKDIREMKCWI